MNAGHFTENPELEARIRGLLRRLTMTNESPGSSFFSIVSGGGGDESSPPPPRGVRMNESVEELRTVPRYRFLLDWFADQFARARGNDEALLALCVKAERDLGDRHRRHPAEIDKTREEAWRREAEQVELLLSTCQGVHAAELAVELGWPIAWIQDQRSRASCDPEWGTPRLDWAALTPEDKRALCARRKAKGQSIRQLAEEVGRSKSAIEKYWPKNQAVAA